MSYNIDHVEAVVLDAWMRAADIVTLLGDMEDELPESNFLEAHEAEAIKAMKTDGDARVKLKNLWFSSESSGTCYPDSLKKIAKKIHGTVEAIFYWEGGNSVTGVLIKDGKFTDCKVECCLVKPEGW